MNHIIYWFPNKINNNIFHSRSYKSRMTIFHCNHWKFVFTWKWVIFKHLAKIYKWRGSSRIKLYDKIVSDITIKNLSLVSPLNIPHIQKCTFTNYLILKWSYDKLEPHKSMKCGMTWAYATFWFQNLYFYIRWKTYFYFYWSFITLQDSIFIFL